MSKLVSGMYRVARAARTIEVIGAAAQGNFRPATTRLKNKFLFRLFGRYLR